MSAKLKTRIDTFIGDFGQMVETIRVAGLSGEVAAEDVVLKECYTDCCATIASKGVLSVKQSGGETVITVDPFLYRIDFSVEIKGQTILKADIADITVRDEELFAKRVDGDVVYRLYEPKASAPRPLILFLHGGGECGSDNLLQLTGTIGAISLAKRFPDMFVLAPQAPDLSLIHI